MLRAAVVAGDLPPPVQERPSMTMKLPLLSPDISAERAVAELTAHRARGAVVKIGPKYRLVLFDDVAHQAGRNPSIALRKIQNARIATENVVRVEGASVRVNLDVAAFPRLAAPLYVCPNGDYQAHNPGTCPYDGKRLQAVDDE
jgi:hypothetical protein